MAAIQPEQTLDDSAIEAPPAQQKPMVEPAGANTPVEIYLSAMAHSFRTTNNLFQSLQGVLAHISQDHQARNNAYSCEMQEKQEMNDYLEEKVRDLTQDIKYLSKVNASLQKRLSEENAINRGLHEKAMELKLFTRTLGDTIAQLKEGREKMIPDSRDAFDAATCPKQTAERGPQLLDWETPVDAQGSGMVVQGGGVVMESSRSELGFESSGIKSYEICPDENNGRSKLRRKRMRQELLTLEIPGKTP